MPGNHLGMLVASIWAISVGLSDLIFGTTGSPYVLLLGGVALVAHLLIAAKNRL